MIRIILRIALWSTACLLLVTCCTANDEMERAVVIDDPSLVQQALQAELDGDSDLRRVRLRQAIFADQENKVARWQAGFVEMEDQWLPARRAHEAILESQPIEQYRKLRDQYSASLNGHVQLASWCRSHGLVDRARLHWFHVLQIDPYHKEARRRLAVQEFKGRLVTADELKQWKTLMNQRRASLDEWTPRLTRWLRTIETAEDARDNDGWKCMIEIADPAAVHAMEKLFDDYNLAARESIVIALGNLPEQVATDALVSIVLQTSDPELLNLATNQLKQRSWFLYVPTLLSFLETPVKYHYSIERWRNNIYGQWHATKENANATVSFSKTLRSQVPLIIDKGKGKRVMRDRFVPNNTNQQEKLNEESLLQARRISQMIANVEHDNQRRAQFNHRIYHILEMATGEQHGPDPKAWWEWWTEYNEYESDRGKPVIYFRRNDYRKEPVPLFGKSCFAAGTRVWTDGGPLPIEQLQVGDLVLSQNSDSGELAYKLVIDRTVRSASPILMIRVGSETIESTLGHPFWVVGKGWQMAKHLKVGDRLHSIEGGREIIAIEPGAELPAFNLVVHETNNYFIGEQQLLVHDNTPRGGWQQPLPGWRDTLPAE